MTMPGSTTVCLLQLDHAGALHACNLGDSGFRVLRNGQVVFASTVQEVTFNMPYQLGCVAAPHAGLRPHAIAPTASVLSHTGGGWRG